MRFVSGAWLLSLGLAAAPASAQSNYVRVNYGAAPTVTQIVAGEPACPDAMVLRSFHLDAPIEYANFDPIYTVRPKKKIIMRRAGQRDDAQDNPAPTPQFQNAFGWNDHKERPTDLQLFVDMQFCEGLETIKVMDGQLSITGPIGHYQLRYETALSGDTQDAINMYWRRTALIAPAPDALGQLIISTRRAPFNARHAESKNHISGMLDLNFNVQIMPEKMVDSPPS